MSKHWIEKYDEIKHKNKMWGEGINPPEGRDKIIDPYDVYFVKECGFTFEFHCVEQLLACKEHFDRKIQPSTKIPESELWKYGGDHGEMQRWFEKLPKGLVSNKQRPKILKAFEKAIRDFIKEK
ncbi:MAG: hypothetical protein ACNI25_04685 [Halarcobacter sp.]